MARKSYPKVNSGIESTTKDTYHYYKEHANRYATLSREEEHSLALAKSLEGRESDAIDKLFNSNLRLVLKALKKFTLKGNGSFSRDDLLSQGALGLYEAVRRFNPEMGFRLETYAMTYIKGYMLSYIYSNRRTTSRYFYIQLKRVLAAAAEFGAEDQEFLSEYLGIPRETVKDILRSPSHETISLDEPLGSSDLTVSKILADGGPGPEKSADLERLAKTARRALEGLDDWERVVVEHLNGIDRPQLNVGEIAQKYGLRYGDIQNLRSRAYRKIRAQLDDEDVLDMAG